MNHVPAGPSTSVTVSRANREWLAGLQRQLAADRGLRSGQDTIDHVIAYLRDIHEKYTRMLKEND